MNINENELRDQILGELSLLIRAHVLNSVQVDMVLGELNSRLEHPDLVNNLGDLVAQLGVCIMTSFDDEEMYRDLESFLSSAGFTVTVAELSEDKTARNNINEALSDLIREITPELESEDIDSVVESTLPTLTLYYKARKQLYDMDDKPMTEEQFGQLMDHHSVGTENQRQPMDLGSFLRDYAMWVGQAVTEPESSKTNLTPMAYMDEYINTCYTPPEEQVREFLGQFYVEPEIEQYMNTIIWN